MKAKKLVRFLRYLEAHGHHLIKTGEAHSCTRSDRANADWSAPAEEIPPLYKQFKQQERARRAATEVRTDEQ